jgi:hypothetical protein
MVGVVLVALALYGLGNWWRKAVPPAAVAVPASGAQRPVAATPVEGSVASTSRDDAIRAA